MKKIIFSTMVTLSLLTTSAFACSGDNIITKSSNAKKSISVSKKEKVRVIKIKVIGKEYTDRASYWKCLNGSFEGNTYFIRFDSFFREYESVQLKEHFDGFDNTFADYEEYIIFSTKKGLSQKVKDNLLEKYSEEIENVSGGYIFLDEE